MTSDESAGAREDAARSEDLLDTAEDDDGAPRPSERLGLAAELVVDCECAAEGLEPPAAAPGAALDVGLVSRVGLIGGFAIQRLEVVVVAVDDVAVVATVLLEVRLFRASQEAGGLVVAVVATELAIVRRGGRAGCLITPAVAAGLVLARGVLVVGVSISVVGALLREV